ncbi:hypothetical protein TSYNTROOL_19740 [Tepidanaerobacter syntrophicus]|nr:hypothetical protein TSYNTROOL_19740 [Tepidanaerobacter syntrophicus]
MDFIDIKSPFQKIQDLNFHLPVPKEIDISKYASSSNIYNNILSIPCDQRYDIEDMKRVAANIKSLIL